MSARVLLLSSVGWPSVARLAAGFAHVSCTVDALAPAGAAIIASRYLSGWHRYNPLAPRASLKNAIAVSRPDLLVCCDDRALASLLSFYEMEDGTGSIGELVRRSLGNPGAIPRLICRNGFIAEASDEGIRVPETLAISERRELDEAIAALGFPLVLKSDGSWGGEGVVIAGNAREAEAGYQRLSRAPSLLRGIARATKRRDVHFAREAMTRKTRRVSAQKFVAGTQAATAFAAWRGDVVGAICYDVLVADGAIGPPNVIRRVDCPQLESATLKIARRFGLSGIHGLDFIRAADGAAHLIEINPRATQGSTLAFGPGRDLPAALASCLVPNAGMRPAVPNDIVAIFPREWRRDPLSRFLASGYHDVPWDDPGVLLASLGLKPRGRSLRTTFPLGEIRKSQARQREIFGEG
ncbi:MAG TPA: hypothetical protein VHT03_02220 [Rhizomicrobium sp.]|jgi:hypothetical protein|nr:hypothetical protein [Rhizomicrobium sp.]